MVCFLSSDPKGILGKLNDSVRVVAPLDGDTGGLKKRVNNGSTRRTNACTETILKKTNIYNLELKCTHTLVYDFYLWWTLQCFTSFFIYVRLAKILFFLQKSKLGFVEITILLVQKFWFETFLNTRSKGQLAQLFNSYRRNLIKVIRVHACKRNIPVSRISSFSWFFFFILHALNL